MRVLEHITGLLSVPFYILQMFFVFMIGLLQIRFVHPDRPKEPYGYVGSVKQTYFNIASAIFCYGIFMIVTFAVGYTALLFAPAHVSAYLASLAPQTCKSH